MSGKSRKSYIRKKPLNFGSSDEYERWKQRQRAILDEQEDKKNPSFTLYTFYYTYVECGHRTKNKKKCVIAAQTQYEAEQIFDMMADYFKIDRPQVRNIVEVYWLQKKIISLSTLVMIILIGRLKKYTRMITWIIIGKII